MITKVPFLAINLVNKIESLNKAKKKEILKTWARSATIVPTMIGHTIAVYNGKEHIPVVITDQMIGHKLGEFSMTRKFKTHPKKKKKLK